MIPIPADRQMAEPTLQCPTCRAQQPWADTCRRCRCDLSLVRQLLEHRRRLERRCLRLLGDGQAGAALQAARMLCRLTVDKDTLRLLALCQLANGRFAEALAACQAARR